MEGDLKRSVVGLCAVAIGLTMFLLVGVGASLAAAPVATIVRPHDDALLTPGKTSVPIVVRSNAGGLSARLELIGRKRGKAIRLHRSAPGVLRGAIPRKALRAGRDHLFVFSRHSAKVPVAGAHFTIGRKVDRGILRVGPIGSHVRSALPVKGKVRPGTVLRASLNGHRVTSEFLVEEGRFSAQLAADNGMRFGHNRLTITAFDRLTGDYRTVVNGFWIGRGAPLVGAGHNQMATVGSRVRLDGSSSAAGHGKLRMKWRIASVPRHSGAHLRGVRTAHPTLVGGRPGVYRLALTASQTGRAGAAPGAAKASSAEAPLTDTTEVRLQPNVLPEGVRIETIVSKSSPEVKVNGRSYPMGNGGNAFLQVVVLDRATLEPVDNVTIEGDTQELIQAEEAIGSATSQDLVIISGGGSQSVPYGPRTGEELGALLESVGGVEVQAQWNELMSGDFSIIGSPGLARGEATQMVGGSLTPGAPAGEISGLLSIDSSGQFAFNWPASDRVPFEIGAPENSNQNTIKVGGQSYTQEVPGGGPGFHLVWVNPTTLALLGQESVQANEGGLATLAARLSVADEAEALVFVSSYGAPNLQQSGNSNFGRPAQAAAQGLREFGANPYAFLGLAGSGGYSFVGRWEGQRYEGPNSAAELVQAETKSPTDRITGELTRSKQGSWVAVSNGSPASFSAEPLGHSVFAKVLAEPLQPFKPLPGAAQLYIYEELFKSRTEPMPNPAYGIRSFYWEGGSDYNAQGFVELQGRLANLPACTTEPCKSQYGETEATLYKEFGEVAQVKRFFEKEGGQGSIGAIFADATGNAGKVFTGVQQYIDGLYGNPAGTLEGEEAYDVYNGVLTVGQGVTGLIPGGEEFSSALTLIQGIGEVGAGLALGAEGESLYNPNKVKTDALEWGEHINTVTEAGFAGLRAASNLFVSDEGRLTKMAEMLKTKVSEGGLRIDEAEETAMRVGIERSEQRYMWTTMLPIAVKVAAPFSGPFNSPLPASGFAAKRGVTEVNVPTGEQPNGNVSFNYDLAPYVITNGVELPSEEVVQRLFGEIEPNQTVAQGPLGFRPKYFLTPSINLFAQRPSSGFNVLQLCHGEEIDNYEVKKSREEYDRKGFVYTVEWIPCTEAEPPYSSEPRPGN